MQINAPICIIIVKMAAEYPHSFHVRFLFLDFITSFLILSNAGNINVVSDIITPDIVEQFGSILNRRRAVPEICPHSKIAICKNKL
jgi:hypothetical protein